MGIDVEVHLNPEFNATHVVDYLTSLGAENVKLELGIKGEPNYFIILFKWRDEDRMLNFHVNYGIFNSHKISLRKWGSSDDIMETIAQRFGGIFVPNDCEDGNATVYDQAAYNNTNALFVHKWALAKGYIDGSNEDDIIEAHRAFNKQMTTNL